MSTLLDLAKELAVIESDMEQSSDDAELLARLTAASMETERKLEGVARWALSLEAEAEAIGTEIARLSAKKQARLNRATSLRKWLIFALDVHGTKDLKTPVISMWILDGKERIEIDDRGIDPGSTFIKAAIKAGAAERITTTKIAKSLIRNVPDWDKQPWLKVLTGERSITIR